MENNNNNNKKLFNLNSINNNEQNFVLFSINFNTLKSANNNNEQYEHKNTYTQKNESRLFNFSPLFVVD